jgi:disulfide bond formation protein DsbB
MSRVIDLLTHPAYLGAALVLTAASVLGGANYFEHVLGLAPCKLCLYQRIPWWLALGLGSMAMLGRRTPLVATIALGLAVLALLANAGLSGYHAGVEYGFWAGPTGCSGDSLPQSLGALNEALKGPPPPRCDEVPWSLFGISMAGYNLILSLATGLAILALMRRAGRETVGRNG